MGGYSSSQSAFLSDTSGHSTWQWQFARGGGCREWGQFDITQWHVSAQLIPNVLIRLCQGVGAIAAGPAMAAPLLAEDRKIKNVSKCQKRGEKRSKLPSSAVQVMCCTIMYMYLLFDMYVGIGSVYDYECDSASKEAYMYVSPCVDIRIGGDKLQCNHVHGVRVDDTRVQCR